MLFKKLAFSIFACSLAIASTTQATEFDDYLKQEKMVDKNFKIQNIKALNELLAIISAEDSRTLPLQIDHNTVIQKLNLRADRTELEGKIITPDFNQFEKDLGRDRVQNMIEKNLLSNCDIFFEHQYQRVNSYTVQLKLKSNQHQYQVTVNQKDCGIQ